MPTAGKVTRFTQQEIKQLFVSARRTYKSAALDVLIAPSHLDYGRILVVTPARIGTAPARNKVRRQCKAIFYQEQLYAHRLDCIVIAKAPIVQMDFDALKAVLFKSLKVNHADRTLS